MRKNFKKPELAQWDTDFFHYKVGKISISNEDELNKKALFENDFKLIYIMSKKKLKESIFDEFNVKIADEKVTLKKNIKGKIIRERDENIKPIEFLDKALLDLTLQSGYCSRFKLDKNFIHNEFEKLYTIWIENSLNENLPGKVFGFYQTSKLIGFITLSLNEQAVDIVLIAVDKQYRGLKIGEKLLKFADNYCLENSLSDISVVTQGANHGALNFYMQNDFVIYETIYIYHLWK